MIDFDRIRRLVDREADLRCRGRELELEPSQNQEAAELFRLASDVRSERLALLRACGLL